jgi:hypothetical protein
VAHAIPAPAEIIVLDDPTPDEAAQRTALLDEIKAVADTVKLSPKDRRDYWAKFCGMATPQTADLAALTDMLCALRYVR